MPGFTAEVALQKSREVYGSEADATTPAGVAAAAIYHCYPCVSLPDGSVGYCCHRIA
jgi:hypothetical protein